MPAQSRPRPEFNHHFFRSNPSKRKRLHHECALTRFIRDRLANRDLKKPLPPRKKTHPMTAFTFSQSVPRHTLRYTCAAALLLGVLSQVWVHAQLVDQTI